MWPIKKERFQLIAYRNGEVAAQTSIKTAEKASQILLAADRNVIEADGYDLSYITVSARDKQGVFDPTCNEYIHFSLEGEGQIVGVCNGDPTTLDVFTEHFCKTFNGLCVLVIQSSKQAGEITIKATSKVLDSAKLTISSYKSKL